MNRALGYLLVGGLLAAAWSLVHLLWDAEWLLTFLTLTAIVAGVVGTLRAALDPDARNAFVWIGVVAYLALFAIQGRFVTGSIAKAFGDPVAARITSANASRGRSSLGAYEIDYRFSWQGREYRGSSAAQREELGARAVGDGVPVHVMPWWPQISGADISRGYRALDLAFLLTLAALPWMYIGSRGRWPRG